MKIGIIKGIEIKLHFSTLLIVAMVGFYSATFYLSLVENAPIWELILVGAINGIILLIAILIHELSHSLMALHYGLNVSEIELYLFGGVSKMEEEPKTPKSEFLISVVGPISSLIIGVIFLILYFLSPLAVPTWITVTFFYSGLTNIGLGIFNLLPAFPMDGGRVLRAFLWKSRRNMISATKTATNIGKYIGYGMMGVGVIQLFLGDITGLWLILMGTFLRSAAKKSYIQTMNEFALSHISIGNLARFRKFVINEEIPLIDAIRDYFMHFNQSFFPVVQGSGNVIGMLDLSDIKKIPMEQRNNYSVRDVMRKISEFPIIFEDETGKEAMKKFMELDKLPHIATIKQRDTDSIIGYVGEAELINALRFWELHAENKQ